MKILSVAGITKTGKTTVVENIIRELKKRGYSVGSVKEIHFEEFGIDTPGTNTDRHRNAGSELVTARGLKETDVLFPGMLPMDKILSFYDQDYCILEGVTDINVPIIITAHNTDEIDSRIDGRTLAVSGVIANSIKEYRGYPVINCISETERLADLIEQKVPELMPDFDADCCSACGCDCRTLLKKILSGEKKRDDCVLGKAVINLSINGKPVKLVPFVQNILRNAVLGVVSELNGYEKDADIEISVKGSEWK
jgi:molybdopterin-guanine dinucleotide biosynthesis adapter protein